MNIQLHYTEHGSGEPLILLHGNGEDSSYFEHQIAFFQDRYRVIAVDTRGHGKSPRGTAPLTLNQFADDLSAFMDELDIASAHILGFSDGANVAMLFALAHPTRVKSLVLNGGNLFPEGLTEQTRREIDEEYEQAVATNDEDQLELLRLMIDEPHIDPVQLSGLNMPTLVVAGTDDMIEEAHTRLIAESIPNAQLTLIEGTHFIAFENPDAFNRVVSEFLVK
ncbi:MAG: alpha/beta fold hydrolase [Eggerthellaceae bacterium]|nr:alpha/beta fold hydrolase [Eggerthellaceae bacterium]